SRHFPSFGERTRGFAVLVVRQRPCHGKAVALEIPAEPYLSVAVGEEPIQGGQKPLAHKIEFSHLRGHTQLPVELAAVPGVPHLGDLSVGETEAAVATEHKSLAGGFEPIATTGMGSLGHPVDSDEITLLLNVLDAHACVRRGTLPSLAFGD